MTAHDSRAVTVSLPSDNQILITREFDAPRHLVYQAWTTPELVKRWWTANRGQITVCDIDLRVGGRWRYAMTTNSGLDVGFHGEYRQIVPGERIVHTEIFEGMPDAEALTTTTFRGTDDRTIVTILVHHSNPADRDAHLAAGMEDGLRDALDLISDVALAGVTISRTFDASPEAVFSAWTEPVQFGRWFATTATTVDQISMDVRPGGSWRARMTIGEGQEIHWHGRYVDVQPSKRLVLTMSDEPGDEYDVLVVVLDTAAGGTTMTFSQVGGHLDAAGYQQVERAWNAFFDDLAAGLGDLTAAG